MVLGLAMLIYLAMQSMLKALIMACLGIFLGTIGTDPIHGVERFTYGSYTLLDGVGLVPVLMGLFGISEYLLNVEKTVKTKCVSNHHRAAAANPEGSQQSINAIFRGTFIGFFIGILPEEPR